MDTRESHGTSVLDRDQPEGIGPITFALVITVNAIVSAVLAVLLTLNVIDRPHVPAVKIASQTASTTEIKGSLERVSSAKAAAKAGVAAKEIAGTVSQKTRTNTARDHSDLQILFPESIKIEVEKPVTVLFQLSPERAAQERYLLIVDGFPAGTRLYGFTRLGINTWRVPAKQRHEIQLIVSSDAPSIFSIVLRLRRDDGALVGSHIAQVARAR